MQPKLILKDHGEFTGRSFGSKTSVAGEVVFATGMVGYPEAITDPSFAGQILVMTYPLVGNYGVAGSESWESEKIWISGLIVANYVDQPSHWQSQKTLSQWLIEQNVPALEISDTRQLTQMIRKQGALLGRLIASEKHVDFEDPNTTNLVAQVSPTKISEHGAGSKTVLLIDCGAKQNIVRELVKRNVRVVSVPWDYDFISSGLAFDSVVISNGPGDPKMATTTISHIKQLLNSDVPILGICLGNQLLTLAAGGDTYKLKYGHRSQNQPALLVGSNRCYLTTQNHGFAVGQVPSSFKPWFINANDGTNEGIIHESKPFMSVQFHPESRPGPTDTSFIFDLFLEKVL